MKLIELLLTALCAAAGIGALSVGNYLEATVICMLPIGYFAVTKARAMRKKRREELEEFWKKEQYTFDRWHAQKAVPKEQTAHDRYAERQKQAYDRHRAMQRQQMDMMHQNSTQAAANALAQQQAAQQSARFGWSDPRAQYGNDLADNIINLWAINSMMNQPSAVHAATASPSGPPVTDTPPSRVDPIQFHSFVNSGSESTSSSSSSSSYSSDTSSDSFGGSDTSSDSF